MPRDKLPRYKDARNTARSGFAYKTLLLYEELTGSDVEEGDALDDLLCDLKHWAMRNGQAFDEALERAESNFQAELRGEP